MIFVGITIISKSFPILHFAMFASKKYGNAICQSGEVYYIYISLHIEILSVNIFYLYFAYNPKFLYLSMVSSMFWCRRINT